MDLTGNGDDDDHEAMVWDTKAVALFTRPRSKHWFALSVIPQTPCGVLLTLDMILVVEVQYKLPGASERCQNTA